LKTFLESALIVVFLILIAVNLLRIIADFWVYFNARHSRPKYYRKRSFFRQKNYLQKSGITACNAYLSIRYKDRKGQITQRDIDVKQFGNQIYGGSMYAYCHLRKDYRTFRFDRVISATDRTTGKFIHDIGLWLNERCKSQASQSSMPVDETG
jgi:hypothetical protein